jgi:hypothetical protein
LNAKLLFVPILVKRLSLKGKRKTTYVQVVEQAQDVKEIRPMSWIQKKNKERYFKKETMRMKMTWAARRTGASVVLDSYF